MKTKFSTQIKVARNVIATLIFYLLYTGVTMAQCTLGFTYTPAQPNLYSFTNTTSIIDTAGVTWYVDGPNLIYVNNEVNPSFYFPVNGTYIVTLQITNCGGYLSDTILVSELSDTGSCHAGMTYYPTDATNFQFNDASFASDSIINYTWHGFTPPDSFIMVNGWTKNTDLSLWAYNNCYYKSYIVTHSITTISGCQSSVIDTVFDYCPGCGANMNPGVIIHYDSIAKTFTFFDTLAEGQSSLCYWQFETVDGTPSFSALNTPVFSSLSDTLHTICLNVYDTTNHCTATVCDTVNLFIPTPTGIQNLTANTEITLYPNPAHNYTTINVTDNLLGSWLNLSDAVGRTISQQQITSSKFNLPTTGLSKGLYLVRITEPGAATIVKKLVIE